jgi:curved DNA-binding protein CbpA
MTAARNLYDILNVSHDAEPVVIEAAWRALMKKYHPDQGGMAEAEAPSAADINRAYSILRDAERRTRYDHQEWTRQQNMHLAQYQPPAPRAPRVFGWGGWVVALLLAGVILLMARDREDFASVDSPGPELATPAQAASEALAKDGPAFLRSGAPEREVDMLRSFNTRSPSLGEAETRSPVSAKPRAAAPKRQKSRPARPRRRGADHNKDFLEREGYIY